MLELLKQNDTDFCKKIRKFNVEYDGSEITNNEIQEEQENQKIQTFVEIRCLGVEDLWKIKFEKVKDFVVKNNKLPSSSSKELEERTLGGWLSRQNKNYKTQISFMKLGSQVRDDFEKFRQEHENLFFSDDELWNIHSNELNLFIEKYNKLPSKHSED